MRGSVTPVLILAFTLSLFTGYATSSGCFPNPCYHGTCFPDITNDYKCFCYVGYQGVRCQYKKPQDRDPCIPNPCENEGICLPYYHLQDYDCICNIDYYYGSRCQNRKVLPVYAIVLLVLFAAVIIGLLPWFIWRRNSVTVVRAGVIGAQPDVINSLPQSTVVSVTTNPYGVNVQPPAYPGIEKTRNI